MSRYQKWHRDREAPPALVKIGGRRHMLVSMEGMPFRDFIIPISLREWWRLRLRGSVVLGTFERREG